MGLVNRVITAINAGVTAFREDGYIPLRESGWDTYEARLFRNQTADRYYNNVAYKALNLFAAQAARRKIDNKLYKRIRGIYNPVNRLVETYVAKVYGGELDLDNLTQGALPIANADDNLRAAIVQLALWSNWRAQKSLFVRQGSNYGNAFLKIVDDTALGRVRMEVLHPGKVKDMEKDSAGNIKRVLIEYERDENTTVYKANDRQLTQNINSYLYTEIITPEKFSTFKDGEPFAYFKDGNGTPRPEWDNPYGFVPIAPAAHTDHGMVWAMNAYQPALDKIDEINDQASLLSDAVRKSVDISWLFIGMQKPAAEKSNTQFSDDSRDDMKALYVQPREGQTVDAKPLVSNLNIADTVLHIDKLLEELERDMPELAMHRLRMGSQMTAPGVKASYNDAIDKFQEAQGNYDDGLSRAISMGVAIGGFRRYDGFQGYNLDTFTKGAQDFYIKPRPIIDDELGKSEKITFLMGSNAPSRAIWKELGVAEDDIDEWEAEAQAAKDAMMLSMDVTPANGNSDPNAANDSNAQVDAMTKAQAVANKAAA